MILAPPRRELWTPQTRRPSPLSPLRRWRRSQPAFNLARQAQRDPSTGKVFRDSATGKLVTNANSDTCCCGPPSELMRWRRCSDNVEAYWGFEYPERGYPQYINYKDPADNVWRCLYRDGTETVSTTTSSTLAIENAGGPTRWYWLDGSCTSYSCSAHACTDCASTATPRAVRVSFAGIVAPGALGDCIACPDPAETCPVIDYGGTLKVYHEVLVANMAGINGTYDVPQTGPCTWSLEFTGPLWDFHQHYYSDCTFYTQHDTPPYRCGSDPSDFYGAGVPVGITVGTDNTTDKWTVVFNQYFSGGGFATTFFESYAIPRTHNHCTETTSGSNAPAGGGSWCASREFSGGTVTLVPLA